jgi:NAD(P)-dependent dehydrogenase (short-subunit alcohol dehydrogenase family)
MTVVLVTGCSSGIGEATAHRLLRSGHTVYATARRPETLEALAAAGARVLPLDVTDDASMVAAVKAIEGEHGAVGALVNNAGYGLQGPIEETSMEEVRRQFETNVFGLVRLTQLVLPGMRAAGGGRIVNISSMGGRLSLPGGGFYHASKWAVEAYSDALRVEVAPFGIRVSVIEPGPVLTPWSEVAVDTIDDVPDGPYAQFRRDLGKGLEGYYSGPKAKLASSADDVARKIERAITRGRPRSRYIVGPVARAMITTRRLLPDRLWDLGMHTSYAAPKVPKP